MSQDTKEIRQIMDDISFYITEGYVFGQKSQDIIPENDSDIQDVDFSNNELSNSNIKPEKIEKTEKRNIDTEVNEIRKIALSVISEITPMSDPEAYKLVKNIWDTCDKFLTKDVKEPKENNIN